MCATLARPPAWLDRTLSRILAPGQRLATRIQRGAFALATLLVVGLGLGNLAWQAGQALDRARVAQASTLEALAGDLAGQLDGITDELHHLSQSSLVWTAISDSAGRESYLAPYLSGRSAFNRLTRITLLDYRGRFIAGGRDPLNPLTDQALAAPLGETLSGGKPVARLLPEGKRLILAFPVRFPATQDVIGILLAEVRLAPLVQSRLTTLGDHLGLSLGHHGEELLAFPASGGDRHQRLQAVLESRSIPGLYRLDLELFSLTSPWLATLASLLAYTLPMLGLLILLTWWGSRRLGMEIAGRLEQLASQVARGEVPQAAPGEQDEIAVLARALGENLRARRALTDNLEDLVARRTRELAEREASYRMLAENIKDVVWLMDADTLRFLYVSPSVMRLRGYSVEEVLAQPVDAALTPRAAEALKILIRERAADCRAGRLAPDHYFTNLVEQPRRDGGRVWTEVITSLKLDPESGHVLILGVTRDIGERLRSEELARFSAFQAGVAEMSVSILHHIGNAITGVLADTRSLRRYGKDLEQVASLLARNVEEVEQKRRGDEDTGLLLERQLKIQRTAASIIHGLGEHAFHERLERIAAGVERIAARVREQQSQPLPADPLMRIDLAQLVEDALVIAGDIGPATGITVDVQMDAGLSTVFLPRNRLLQTLLLALRNARDAIQARQPGRPGSGHIGIRVQDLAGSHLRLSVEDDGIGLDAELRRNLFDPGQSPRPGGGLSLHGAALFAQSLGGRLSLESEGEDKGSRFILELPCLPEVGIPAENSPPRAEAWSPSP